MRPTRGSHYRTRSHLTLHPLDDRCLLSGYTFEPIAALGDAAFDSEFSDYFQIGGLNNRSDVAFVTNLPRPDDGSFRDSALLARDGQFSLLARTGEADPAGGVFGGGVFAPVSLNDRGDVAFAFDLEPFAFPVEVNAGLYRYSQGESGPTAVVVPGTPAPGGGTFPGVGFGPHINARGDIAFSGVVPTDLGPGEEIGLGIGLFEADPNGHVRAVARPGDVAPGGETFDWAAYPWSNRQGDIVFMGHTIEQGPSPPPEVDIFCPSAGIYRSLAGTGEIERIVRPGDPSPDGGVFEFTFFPRINDHNLFFAAWTSANPGMFGVFAESGGVVDALVSPGDPLPGGGHFVSLAPGSTVDSPIAINDRGDVEFLATLDTDDNQDGRLDTGLYQWSRGSVDLIARTDTVLPGLGTVRHIRQHDTAVNDRGQVAFWARLTDRREVLILATPGAKEVHSTGLAGFGDDATGRGSGGVSLTIGFDGTVGGLPRTPGTRSDTVTAAERATGNYETRLTPTGATLELPNFGAEHEGNRELTLFNADPGAVMDADLTDDIDLIVI
jgi:hypothetical protein